MNNPINYFYYSFRYKMNDENIKEAINKFKELNEDVNNSYFYTVYGPFSNWNISKVKNTAGLFKNMVDFNENIVLWDVRNVQYGKYV